MPVKPAWKRSVAFAIHRVKFLPLDEKDEMVTLVQGRSNTRGEPRDWTIHKDTLPRTDPKCGAGVRRRTFVRRRGVDLAFAATRQLSEESYLLTFDEASRPCRLRSAEAARFLSSKISIIGPRLHGWALLLDAGAKNAEDAFQAAKRLWFGITGDGLYVSNRSKAYFEDYFLFGPAGPAGAAGAAVEGEAEARTCIPVLDAIYARPGPPCVRTDRRGSFPDDRSPCRRSRGARRRSGCGDFPRRARAGRGPSLCLEAALSKLYSDASRSFLRLAASSVESAPYGPIASVLGALVSPRKGVSGPATCFPAPNGASSRSWLADARFPATLSLPARVFSSDRHSAEPLRDCRAQALRKNDAEDRPPRLRDTREDRVIP